MKTSALQNTSASRAIGYKIGVFAQQAANTRRLSVIAVVVNWNGWRDTLDCIESVLDAERRPEQIVLCDNGSMDMSVELLEEAFARRGIASTTFSSPAQLFAAYAPESTIVIVRCGENLGYAGANNLAMRYALERCDAEFVWILNNDVIVDRAALERMLDLAGSDASIGIVGARLLRADAPETIQAMGGGYILPVICHDTQLGMGQPSSRYDDTPIVLDHLIGACLLVRAAAIRSTGTIDASYFLYREETDWCIRMRRHGWKLVCCAAARVWHRQSRSAGFKSPLHDYYSVRNMLRLVRRFYPLCLPVAFTYFVSRALVPKIARLQFARIGAVLEAVRDFMLGVSGRGRADTDEALFAQYVVGRQEVDERGEHGGGREAFSLRERAAREGVPERLASVREENTSR